MVAGTGFGLRLQVQIQTPPLTGGVTFDKIFNFSVLQFSQL